MKNQNDLFKQYFLSTLTHLGNPPFRTQAGLRLASMLLTLIFLATLAVQPAYAGGGGNDLYVAKTGIDTSGCLVTPCLTVAYAISQAGNTDRIHIGAGTYIENLTPNKVLSFYGASMNSTILDGGGVGMVINNNISALTIANLTIRNGYNPSGTGGGIFTTGPLTLSNVKVTGNVALDGGGITTCNTLTMTDSVVSNNSANIDANGDGGGLYLCGSTQTITLTRVTISGNTATLYSGGIHNQGSGALNMTNVTIAGNTGKIDGAMINTNSATTYILNSTIAGNHSSDEGGLGGISNFATITFKNTVIAANDGSNCYNGKTWTSLGYNLDSGSSCNFILPGDLQNINPKLGPLANNGGPTQTMALYVGSPAIDAGSDSGCPATDQRGVPRPQGRHCDIGAYEAVILYLPLVIH